MIERMAECVTQSLPHPADAARTVTEENGERHTQRKAMHGQSRLQGRHGLSALVTRSAIKMDLPDKKGIGIIGGVYGMIKGGLQKRNKTGIPGQCSPSVLPGLPSPYIGAVSRKQSPRPDGRLSLFHLRAGLRPQCRNFRQSDRHRCLDYPL